LFTQKCIIFSNLLANIIVFLKKKFDHLELSSSAFLGKT